jgi:uncharacterized protein (DUF2141 family)
MNLLNVLLTAACGLFTEHEPVPVHPVQLSLSTASKKGSGLVYLTVFQSGKGFPDNASQAVRALKIPLQQGVARTVLNLPRGRYAIAAFYDADGNGKLSKNLVGAPSEPYGFSNNVRALFSAPSFPEAAFDLHGGTSEIRMELK